MASTGSIPSVIAFNRSALRTISLPNAHAFRESMFILRLIVNPFGVSVLDRDVNRDEGVGTVFYEIAITVKWTPKAKGS